MCKRWWFGVSLSLLISTQVACGEGGGGASSTTSGQGPGGAAPSNGPMNTMAMGPVTGGPAAPPGVATGSGSGASAGVNGATGSGTTAGTSGSGMPAAGPMGGGMAPTPVPTNPSPGSSGSAGSPGSVDMPVGQDDSPGTTPAEPPATGDDSTMGGAVAPDPTASDPGAPSKGTSDSSCCSDGDCLCHGPGPSGGGLTYEATGPYRTESYRGTTGTIHYPTDAEPPFAGVALCGGFLNTGPEMAGWGPFYASHGIVTIITTTTGADFPDIRATKLLAAIKELAAENTKSGGPLFEKMSGRYGTSGYSMGGGGTTIASTNDSSLKTSVGLAAWGPVGPRISVPTLLLCGSSDSVAPCSQSSGSYRQIPDSTPKMMVEIPGTTHFNWFGPRDAGRGASGAYALAFQKTFLEGDERWAPMLQERAFSTTVTSNIQ